MPQRGRKLTDLTGQRFGVLTATEIVKPGHDRASWRCRCHCGREVIVRADTLVGLRKASCGCLRKCRRKRRGPDGGFVADWEGP
jgi:hypothetical protein